MADESIQCCITSPPYWGLRDYGVDQQLGLEKTPEEYVSKMVEIFREVKRVLRKDGTLWLNLGDSYNGSGGAGGDYSSGGLKEGQPKYQGRKIQQLKPKDLVGIPWRVAFALQSDGWYLRQDIIWHKPNPMPESVTDRCTKAHEYIFLMSKNSKYYYDNEAIKEPITDSTAIRLLQDIENQKGSDRVPGKTNGPMKAVGRKKFDSSMAGGGTSYVGHSGYKKANSDFMINPKRNKRSVWTVTTKPFKEAHFATFPPALILPCILAGTAEGQTILDPFMGAGTVASVCEKYNRKWQGIELNEEYCQMIQKRIENETRQLKLFN